MFPTNVSIVHPLPSQHLLLEPGRLSGTAVDVVVTVVMDFAIR
jgi:hypothetical protein